MPKLLSTDEVADYRDRGYHFPIDALSAGEVTKFRRRRLPSMSTKRRPSSSN
ncbi:MAG TPA: hypothetical protein VN968_06730 [Bradyrhizobium sp.]|nr:hypothetical protein [Bradyrhizobium sp.]